MAEITFHFHLFIPFELEKSMSNVVFFISEHEKINFSKVVN